MSVLFDASAKLLFSAEPFFVLAELVGLGQHALQLLVKR